MSAVLEHRTPPGVLGRIVARTASDVAASGPAVGARTAGPVRSLAAALGAPGLSLLAEVKPRSPSQGTLFDVEGPFLDRLLAAYAPAAALSVLVDGPDFGGSWALLRRVRARVPQPVLAKGFFLSPVQVVRAHAAGADAILLMASVLPPRALGELLAVARGLGLEALVETHDDAELDEVLAAGARIVGVNSRDLSTLEIDLSACRRRLERVPSDRIRVAESGLRTRGDLDAMRSVADAALIGTALAGAPDPAAAVAVLGFGGRA